MTSLHSPPRRFFALVIITFSGSFIGFRSRMDRFVEVILGYYKYYFFCDLCKYQPGKEFIRLISSAEIL